MLKYWGLLWLRARASRASNADRSSASQPPILNQSPDTTQRRLISAESGATGNAGRGLK